MWLAISGGIDVPLVLGSRSTDMRAGFGGLDGRALRDRDELPIGEMNATNCVRAKALRDKALSSWSAQREWTSTAVRYPILRIVRGVDWSRFDAFVHEALTNEKFTVTPEADRMGVRLDGPELKRQEQGDLLSEAVAPGTIQVPPNGKPILLLGDCQTIGGYPKIAHVITVDLPIAAQLRTGDEVQFHETSISEAHSLLLQREEDLARFRIGLDLRT
jgi:antagonist of KipI